MVGCVVLNWNGWRDTVACLRTLALQQGNDALTVYVVDNGSTDESVAQLKMVLPTLQRPGREFRLIEHPENVGFARGTNVGVRPALADGAEFLWLLNNDTECPPDTLEKLLRVARAQPDAGIVGTVLYYFDNPTKVQAWSGGHVSRWTATATHRYEPFPQSRGVYVTFASALVRADVLRQIGLLYEGSFMYYDDSDLCLRMEATPWKIAVATDTAVLHKEGASFGEARNPFMEKTITVSGLRFLKRHAPIPVLAQLAFLTLKVANRVRRREWQAVRAVLRGAGEYLREPMPLR